MDTKKENYYREKVIRNLNKEGYIKNEMLKVKFNSKPSTLKKGDLVITFEIHKIAGKFKPSYYHPSKNQFSVSSVLPICSTLFCNKKSNCSHQHIMSSGEGQQGITKILKQRK